MATVFGEGIPQQFGQNPQGAVVPIPVGGAAFLTIAPLAANGNVNSGWINTTGYGALLYVIRASHTGSVTVEYSDDGINPIQAGFAVTYDQIGMQIQRTLVPKGKYTRISYINGGTAQSYFRMEVKLSTTLIHQQ